jgi:hypothetical protein
MSAPFIPVPAAPHAALTARRHFRFGYDSEVFALRPTPAARYWTAYGAVSRPETGFAGELEHALAALAGIFGRLAICHAGGPVGAAAIVIAERLGIPARVTTLELDGVGPLPPRSALPVEHHALRFVDFEAFALDLADRVGCADPWTALAAFHVAQSELPAIADHGELRLINHGIDDRLRQRVAPADLALVDNEAFTAIDRWMIDERRAGVAQMLRWSPELMAAQLGAPQLRAWIAMTLSGDGAPLRLWSSQAARAALWRSAFPEIGHTDVAAAWEGIGLAPRMRGLGRRMGRRRTGVSMQHFTPLHRLASRLGLDFGPALAEAAAIYGTVAAMPPVLPERHVPDDAQTSGEAA